MTNGLLGRKLAMTQIFDKDGNFIPVTLVEAGPCTVLEVNEEAQKVTLGYEDAKENRLAKPQVGYFKKVGVTPKRTIKEFKYDESALNNLLEQMQKQAEEAMSKESESVSDEAKEDTKAEATQAEATQEGTSTEASEDKTEKITEESTDEVDSVKEPTIGVGSELKVNLFKPGDYVDVSGISVGKGFQGGMKRWGWAGGPESHGSRHHRKPGAIGMCADPSKVLKGTHLPGRMGGKRATAQGIRVMAIDCEKNLLILKGAVPGSKNGLVEVRKSFKKAWRDLNEVKAVAKQSANPMKQSKKAKK